MNAKRMRLLLLCSHPVQYASPMWRRLAQRADTDVLVAYCSLRGAAAHVDPGFGVQVEWDVPLLEGYPWMELRSRLRSQAVEAAADAVSRGIWKLIRSGNFDAVFVFTGYRRRVFWIALLAAKLNGVPVLFGTDATGLEARDGKKWKIPIKRYLLQFIFRLADIAIAPSYATQEFFRDLGIRKARVALLPFVVDNDWWHRRAGEIDRNQTRKEWGIPEDARVILFCAKLQPWKRPEDALRAFAQAKINSAYLVFAGDGPLKAKLEAEAESLGISAKVRFLGFVNQTGLPKVYGAADILVLPSEYDACPVVVCEAMLCGCPVLLSDHVRGRLDLVKNGETGFVYPCGDIRALASRFRQVLEDRQLLERLACGARKQIANWSPELYVESLVRAAARARNLRRSAKESLQPQKDDPGTELIR